MTPGRRAGDGRPMATAWFGPCPHCRIALSYLQGVTGSTMKPTCPGCRQPLEVTRATFQWRTTRPSPRKVSKPPSFSWRVARRRSACEQSSWRCAPGPAGRRDDGQCAPNQRDARDAAHRSVGGEHADPRRRGRSARRRRLTVPSRRPCTRGHGALATLPSDTSPSATEDHSRAVGDGTRSVATFPAARGSNRRS